MAQPPAPVLELIERFDRNHDAYCSPHYNETQLRREFLDPLFKALGWDMENEQGYAEAYKDVVHEDAIKVGEATKAPDYSFRIGGTRKFFLEAKRPSVDIKHDASPAFQLRRYAWTTKLPLSILSDFEEFAVYDCRFKPHHRDDAASGRILYLSYADYAARWDEIAGVFSREAVLKGAFDQFADSTRAKRGTADVDDEFLKTIEDWRAELARNLALRNPSLTQRQLNFSVQRIIDRLIFLRICEGRGIEDYGRLRALVNGDRIYPRLCQLFEAADARYNSGLFHFQPEKDRHEAPDELTLKLEVDDRLLRDLIRSIYYPESPYVFSALPADILGQVYEQFLGKVIRLTDGHRAVVEEKPEVKKAGGVYYTPTYIVDYIVQNTVGKLLEGKTPRQAAKLRILDPACGSGSFLIGAYEHLLRWHRDFYIQHDPAKWAKGPKPVLVQVGPGDWRLTIAERKRILLDNVYGVDIDAQAVETTKLSLLLKVLEGETQQSLQPVLRLFHERALPDLGDNIKCGNSLIGPDFYQQQQMALLDEEERYRVNVFDWAAEFPHILQRGAPAGDALRDSVVASPLDYMVPGVPLHGAYAYKNPKPAPAAPVSRLPEWEGGFDAVIGNPPYVRIQGFPRDQIAYLTHRYGSATGNCDLYVSFVERGYALLRQGGVLGMIAPNKFFRTDYGEGLRRLLSTASAVSRIVDFGANQVFSATTYTCLLFLQKGGVANFEYAKSQADPKDLRQTAFSSRPAAGLSSGPWTFESEETAALLDKLARGTKRLLDLPADMSRGSSTGDDNIFVFEAGALRLEESLTREPLFASDFGRYRFAPSGRWQVIFPYVCHDGAYRLYSEQELRSKFPRAFAYLREKHQLLKQRKQYAEWFGYSAPRNLALHDRAQIAVPLLADRGLFCLIPPRKRGRLCPMASGGFTIAFSGACSLKPEYVLGLLNSKLLFWRLRTLSNVFRGGWITCTKQYFGQLPIRTINFSDPAEKNRHDRLVQLVEQMLALHQSLSAAKTPQEKTALERQTAAADTQIDRLVYDLYGLTEEEISIVEQGA
ncbi:MAG TPA: N-6 DNA methylase [Candidatus Acidoferrum sp.]|nr:N-6 DNA methylase [Candidatus Acidoferrum sp.]